MRFSLFLIPALLSGVFAMPVEGDSAEAEALQPETQDANQQPRCVSRRSAVPFFRAFNPTVVNHFYTTNANELRNAVQNLGYRAEGIAAYIFPRQETGTQPLFRLFSPSATNHFYTTDRNERMNAMRTLGYNDEGIAGWVYTRDICRSVPFFRLFNAQRTDHLYTTSASERRTAQRSGYREEGIAAYVLNSNR